MLDDLRREVDDLASECSIGMLVAMMIVLPLAFAWFAMAVITKERSKPCYSRTRNTKT